MHMFQSSLNIFCTKKSHHNRLILRISVKVDADSFTNISFVCDSGAPMYLYLSPKAKRALAKRILTDEISQSYIIVNGSKKPVVDTPATFQPANLLGLMMLVDLGLCLNDGFIFIRCPEYF